MKVWVWVWVLIGLMLGGCYPVEPRAAEAVAGALARETERARLEMKRQASLEAAQAREAAEWEIAQIEAAMRGTMTAWEAAQGQGLATVQAGERTATAEAGTILTTQTAMPMMMTQTAAPRVMAAEAERAAVRDSFFIMWQIVRLALVVAGTVILLVYLRRLFGWLIEERSLKARLRETTSGQVIGYVWGEGEVF